MKLSSRKNEIKKEIDKIEDERLLWAIERLLNLDDVEEIPEWHRKTVQEREAKYESGTTKMLDWEKIKKRL